MADAPLSAALDLYRSVHREIRHPSTGEPVCDSDRHRWPCDASKALDAIEAVLKAAGDWEAEAGRLDEKVDEATPGNDTTRTVRAVMLSTRAQAHADLAAAVRAAIARALTGKDHDHG